MGSYLIAGRPAGGARVVEQVEATNAKEAVATLEARGFRDLELLGGDLDAVVVDEFRADGAPPPRGLAQITPGERARIDRSPPSYLAWLFFKKTWWIVLPAAGYLIARWAFDALWSGCELVALLVIGLAVWLAILVTRASLPYRRLVEAGARGDWNDVLRRLPAVERGTSIRPAVPAAEIAWRRACALIGLGRDEEALAGFAAVAGGSPPWFHELRLADLHSRRFADDEADAAFRRAVELAPETPETHLSYAEFLAGFRKRDPRTARQCLERARRLPLAANVQWAVHRVEGMIAVEEGDLGEARAHLEAARTALARLRNAGLHELVDAHIGAYLCLALAGLGERDAARRELTAAETWLRPHGLEPLLARCREAVG